MHLDALYSSNDDSEQDGIISDDVFDFRDVPFRLMDVALIRACAYGRSYDTATAAVLMGYVPSEALTVFGIDGEDRITVDVVRAAACYMDIFGSFRLYSAPPIWMEKLESSGRQPRIVSALLNALRWVSSNKTKQLSLFDFLTIALSNVNAWVCTGLYPGHDKYSIDQEVDRLLDHEENSG
jgi:hypothetical protein